MTKIILVDLTLAMLKLPAQNLTVTGCIKDADSRETIGFCNVVMADKSIDTVTNTSGKFLLQLRAVNNKAALIMSYLGYRPDTILIDGNKKEFII